MNVEYVRAILRVGGELERLREAPVAGVADCVVRWSAAVEAAIATSSHDHVKQTATAARLFGCHDLSAALDRLAVFF